MDANHAIWVEIEAIKQAQRRIGRIQDSRTGCRAIGLQDWGLQGYRLVQNNWSDTLICPNRVRENAGPSLGPANII